MTHVLKPKYPDEVTKLPDELNFTVNYLLLYEIIAEPRSKFCFKK
jgi:hypothetical protein